MWFGAILVGLIVCLGISPTRSEPVRLVTYHVSPPYIVDEKRERGLTYELAKLLSKRSNGKFEFTVETMSRPGLNELLNTGDNFVTPWVNKLWFSDLSSDQVHWSAGYIDDANALISIISKPFEYSGPKSLVGKKVAGLRGGRWAGIDPLIKQGVVVRIDSTDYWGAMRHAIKGTADIAIIPYTVARFLIASHLKTGQLHFSAVPHSRYKRQFLVKNNRDVESFIDEQINFLKNSPEWASTMKSYGL